MRFLGNQAMIVGTNALVAYAIEANAFIRDAPDATLDFDLALTAVEADAARPTLWKILKEVDMTYAKRKNLSRYEVLIIASLIEREAQLARERRLVSAVIYNRLAEGMPLGIDATTRYSTNNWTKPIKQSEIEKDEPFNTRINRGLPPTPIGNPGLASIKAAAKPSSKKYLYYVRKANDDSGEHAFSTTYSEFEKDLARYNASRGDG